MKTILSLLVFFTYLISYAQMGVGTTSPDASAQLDISANDKGVLVPRINLSNVTQTTLDGSNTAATGLLIWNTNASTDGGNGVGFYFFNGVQWMPITQENRDADWYEENTTTPANAITDDIYTNGNVGIGVSNVQYPLQISSSTASRNLNINNTSNGSSIYSIYNNIIESSASTGNTIGLVNIISRTGQSSIIGVVNGFSNAEATVGYGYLFGYDNSFSSTTSLQSVGLINRFQGTTTSGYGVKNLMSGTATNYYGLSNYNLTSENLTATIYGLHNDLNGIGNGSRYGVYTNFTEIGGGAKYGEYIHIASGAGGTHYGIYANVTKATGYAGYFLGRVAIGNLSTNTYILPSSRGTNGQVMQTDGSGNITWRNPTSVFTDTDNQLIDELNLTGDLLNISLQDDGVATQTLNLSSIDNQNIDFFSISGNVLSLSLANDGVPSSNVDLSIIDNQSIDALSLSGNILNLSLSNDGVANQTLDLSTFANDWKTTGNAGTVTGVNFIGTTDSHDLDFRTNNIINLRLTQKGQLTFKNTGKSIFIGEYAGEFDDNLANHNNVFIGNDSGYLCDSGSNNTAIGYLSLNYNTSGYFNTAIGVSAMELNGTGYENTVVGSYADVTNSNFHNSTAIGYAALINTSNKIQLGNSNVTVIEGQVAYSYPSDARFKFNVQENIPGLDFIMRLKPVTYHFDTEKFEQHLRPKSKAELVSNDYSESMSLTHSGFLAQDVEQICKDLGYEFDGLHIPDASNPHDHYSVAYSQFIMPLVKAVQEQQEQIENYELRIANLETENQALKSEIEKLKTLEERIKVLEGKLAN